MRVLVFNWKDLKHPGAGGAEVLTYENAKRWVKKGCDVTWFAAAFDGCKKQEEIDGIKIVRAGNKYTVYNEARKFYKHHAGKFDIVIDETNTRPFFAKDFVKDAGVVFFIHQLAKEWWFYETRFPMNAVGYFLEPFWLRRYSNYPTVTVSASTQNDLFDLGFKDVRIIPEGISFKPFKRIPEKSEKPVIIYLGRLNRGKRILLALKAFEKVVEHVNAEFWIVGDGYLRKEIEKRAVDGVKLFGKVSEEKKIELLSKAWLQVNPSVREGWGINVIEGNACGAPCIAFDVPGLRDSIRDGETGLLVKKDGDADELAKAIIRVLKDDKLRERLSKNSLKWAKMFSWDKSAKEFMKILEEVSR